MGILSRFGMTAKEKKALDNAPKPIEGVRSEEDIQFVSDIFAKFRVAREAKAKRITIWNKCIDAYNSDYFKDNYKPDYKSDEISNFIFSTVETIKPIMLDNDPKIMALPRKPDSMEVAEKIQSAFEYEWIRAKMSQKLPSSLTTALQIGTAIFFMPWNKNDEKGLGNVNPTIVNPFNLFPDPMATSVEDAEYIIYATYKHVNKLKLSFPDKANLLDGGTINYSELVPLGQDTTNVSNQMLVLECYMRDYTTVDEDVTDDNGQKLRVRRRKYPNGRILTICPEATVILNDKANPYDDGKFPFQLIKCYDIPFEFWGKGEIEQLLSPQTYINDLMNQIIDNAKLTANMPWVLDKNCGIGKGQLTNRPGLIVRKNPGSEVKRLQPPSMPNYVADMVETLKRDIETISGIHDVTQGRKPGSVSAASAIIALQEAAQARIRLKVKMMELSLGELGQMWYSRLQQFWTTNRWVRVTDSLYKTQFSEITPSDLTETLDFLVVAGSTMPVNKASMLDMMIRLAQTQGEDGLPMVDRESVLYYTNIPDKRKIIERMNELSGRNKQQQQQQVNNDQQLQQAQAEHQMAHDQQMQDTNNQAMLQKQQMMMQQGQATNEANLQKQAMSQNAQIPPDVMQQIVSMLKNEGVTDQQIQKLLQDPNMVQQLMLALPSQQMQPVA